MATHHASPSEIVDLKTWANDLPASHSKAIVKTEDMELARFVYSAGDVIPNHKVSGPIVIHCIEGEIEVNAMGTIQTVKPEQLLHLLPEEPYSIHAITDAVVLFTFVFKT